MDFDLSEEQRLLKESVDGLLNDSYGFDARKKYAAEKGGWSKSVWGKLAEQGLLGLPFSEDDGGFGAGAVEIELKALELTQLRVVADENKHGKGKPNPASSVLKIKGSEIQQTTT